MSSSDMTNHLNIQFEDLDRWQQWFATGSLEELEVAVDVVTRIYNTARECGDLTHAELRKPFLDCAIKKMNERFPGWDIPF